MMNDALKITNLTKTYSDFKLNHIDLTIPTGCIMGFIGENGAGKTTTIKLILDLIRREEGEILFYGSDIKFGGNKRRSILVLY